MSVETNSFYPEGLFVERSHLPVLQAKMGAIALQGIDSLEGVIDFDNNMTRNGKAHVSSWGALSELLPSEAQSEDQRMYDHYHPKELDHTLTTLEAESWWNGNFQLYVDSNISAKQVEQASKKVVLRQQVGEFFDLCGNSGIHTTIFSAGVEDVIRNVITRERIKTDLVVSNRFIIDEETGLITGWDKDNLIHTLNKNEHSSARFRQIRQRRPNTFLVGDSIEDTSMVDDDDRGKIIRVRVGDPHKIPSSKVNEFLEESFLAGFDAVRLGDFGPVKEMLGFIVDAAGVIHDKKLAV